MNRSRGKAAVVNSSVATFSQIVLILMQFIARTIFIHELGEQYLGLNGLFTNLLNMLNLAELGIGSAITFSLFEPIFKEDKRQVAAIMHLLRKWYRIIAAVVFVGGLILVPFIPYLIHNSAFSNWQLYIFFVLALSGTVSTYLLSYKRTLLIADQLGYINTLNTVAYSVVQQTLQIVFLVIYPNFYVYLIIQVLSNLISNYNISRVVDRRYPFLNETDDPVDPSILSYFRKNVVGMISAKLGGIVVNSTDNILISYFMGLADVGKYANYTLITTGLTSVLTQAVTAVSSSIGNLAVSKRKRQEVKVFNQYFSITVLVSLLMSVGLASFSTAFIHLWIGSKYLLGTLTVFLIAFNFLLQSIRQALISYSNSYGLYWQQRYKPIFESAVNLIISIILIKYTHLGISAVLIGTIASNLFVNYWWEPLAVFKYGFFRPVSGFLAKYAVVIFVSACLIAGSQIIGYKIAQFWLSVGITIINIIVSEVLMLLVLRLCGMKINIRSIVKRVFK